MRNESEQVGSPLGCTIDRPGSSVKGLSKSIFVGVAPRPGPLTVSTTTALQRRERHALAMPTPRPAFIERKTALGKCTLADLKDYVQTCSLPLPTPVTKERLVMIITTQIDQYSIEEIFDAPQQPLPKRGRPKKCVAPAPSPQLARHMMVSPSVNDILDKANSKGMKALNSQELDTMYNQLLLLNGALSQQSSGVQGLQTPAALPSLPPSMALSRASPSLLSSIPAPFPLEANSACQDAVLEHLKNQVLTSVKLGIFPLFIYHSTTTQPKQLLAVACRNAYGNRAGLQLFVAKMSSRLPDWFKNCRNATSALLEAIESEARQRPLAPTANLLLHPSPLWKLFHRLFPLSKGVDEATLRTYADWIDSAPVPPTSPSCAK